MNKWVIYALLTILFFGSDDIIRKYLFLDKSLKKNVTFFFTFFLGLFMLITSFLLYFNNNDTFDFKSNKKSFFLSMIAALFATIGILANNMAIFHVDNVSKSTSLINPGVIIFVFLASILFFNQSFNFYHLFGIILCSMGIMLVNSK